MEFNILEIILFVFLTSLLVTVLFRKLRLSIILGYLVVGAMVGPHALGLVPESHAIHQLAEFGIVFLMFTVGLEFSLPKLFSLKFPVFVIGGLQVLLTIAIMSLAGPLLGISNLSALVTGSIIAMSSTAIVIKQLNDQMELHSPHGLNAIGILLFQDLAVIPLIILIAELAKGTQHNLTYILLWAVIKGILAIFFIFLSGRLLLRPLFKLIAKTRAIELFTLTVLLVTLMSAWLTNLFGLSFALGAFLAGLMLAETEFRHQIEVEMRPFRDILLGLFFITIGMLTDIKSWDQTWIWILLLVVAIIVGKMILITVISRFSGNELSSSCRTGLVLAQGGEFGFAILTLALNHNVLSEDYGQIVLAALLISIAISPILIRFNKEITTLLLPKEIKMSHQLMEEKISDMSKDLKQHIIICGYGRVGQHIARLLNKIHFPYIALDLDPELVKHASMAGEQVIYGDPTHPEILKAAGLDNAKILVISFNDLRASLKIISMVKHSHPHLPILARCRDEFELKQLQDSGATKVIAELFEASLTLSHDLLSLVNIPPRKILELMQEVRSKNYALLYKVFTGSFAQTMDSEDIATEQLKPILIIEGSFAINKKLKDLNLEETGVEIIGIRRGEKNFIKPSSHVKINEDDIIILSGPQTNLENAERKLLSG